ncbi:MAG: hypothetical protein JSV67_03360, partial [Thermoplasmatales archaeon]
MYPFAQSIFSNGNDEEIGKYGKEIFNNFTKNTNLTYWEKNKKLLGFRKSENKDDIFDLIKISAVSDMQFGKDAGKILLNGNIRIVKSKKKQKIRNIYCNGKHVLSMRANDGMFTLKIEGGNLLHKGFKKPILRVIVNSEAIPFIKEGKSVFSKFVKECDPNLRPLDECLIVDEKDSFLAVGRCLLNRLEMLSFNYGMAVKIREYIK